MPSLNAETWSFLEYFSSFWDSETKYNLYGPRNALKPPKIE